MGWFYSTGQISCPPWQYKICNAGSRKHDGAWARFRRWEARAALQICSARDRRLEISPYIYCLPGVRMLPLYGRWAWDDGRFKQAERAYGGDLAVLASMILLVCTPHCGKIGVATSKKSLSGVGHDSHRHRFGVRTVAATRPTQLPSHGNCQASLIEIEMPDLPETNATRSSAKRRWPLWPVVVAGMLLLLLAVCFFPYWLDYSFRRGREEYTQSQIGTNSLFDPDPRVLQELTEDRDNASKVTKVYIGELSGPHFAPEHFQALKRLPHLKRVEVMYVGKGDDVLANIQGMATIEELSFYHAGVTATGTRYLSSFPNLKHLDIDRVDDEMRVDIEKLQKALPNCKIYWHDLEEDEREMLRKRD